MVHFPYLLTVVRHLTSRMPSLCPKYCGFQSQCVSDLAFGYCLRCCSGTFDAKDDVGPSTFLSNPPPPHPNVILHFSIGAAFLPSLVSASRCPPAHLLLLSNFRLIFPAIRRVLFPIPLAKAFFFRAPFDDPSSGMFPHVPGRAFSSAFLPRKRSVKMPLLNPPLPPEDISALASRGL